jgi:hypothetical protein
MVWIEGHLVLVNPEQEKYQMLFTYTNSIWHLMHTNLSNVKSFLVIPYFIEIICNSVLTNWSFNPLKPKFV